MRALLAAAVVVAACCVAGSATAAAPVADARAWLVMDPVTGEVLAEHHDRYQVPIASITKLMTMIVALEHLKLSDVVHVDPRAAAVGQESIYLQAGQAITVADLVKGSHDPVGKRCRRRARARDRAQLPRVRQADEREGEAARSDRLALRPARRARRARRVLERARRDEARASQR